MDSTGSEARVHFTYVIGSKKRMYRTSTISWSYKLDGGIQQLKVP